ncbi:hypothetical protein GCM10027174_45280 [Salinifilum aidingensis]
MLQLPKTTRSVTGLIIADGAAAAPPGPGDPGSGTPRARARGRARMIGTTRRSARSGPARRRQETYHSRNPYGEA